MKSIRNIFCFSASFRIVFLHILKGVSRILLLSALAPYERQVIRVIASLRPAPIALPLRRRVLCRLSRSLPAASIAARKKKQDMLEKIF